MVNFRMSFSLFVQVLPIRLEALPRALVPGKLNETAIISGGAATIGSVQERRESAARSQTTD